MVERWFTNQIRANEDNSIIRYSGWGYYQVNYFENPYKYGTLMFEVILMWTDNSVLYQIYTLGAFWLSF